MPDSLVPHKQLESAVAALTSMQEALNIPLRLFAYKDAWLEIRRSDSQLTDAASDSEEFVSISALPVPSKNIPQPFLFQSAADRHVIGFPLEATRHAVIYAVGETAHGMESLLRAVSQQAAQLSTRRDNEIQKHNALDDFADQVLRDFEERNWLLQLTHHLELCEVSRDLKNVAESLMPHLKEILCACSVVFVPESSIGVRQGSSRQHLCHHGSQTPEEISVFEIIRRYRNIALVRPFVRNWSNQENSHDQMAGINSLMLVSVSRNSEIIGWLVAVNREVDANNPIRVSVDPDDPSFTDNGFSTVEAGLLQNAAAMLATHHQNLKMFQANQNLTVGVVRSLANAVDARDTYTHGHSDRVARMARHLARRNGADSQSCEQILMTGLVHDIGKIGVPDHVLLKPGRLDPDEFELIKQHPVIGHGILHHIKELSYTLDGVLYHHEAWNGKGYPKGLQGTDIPLDGRILAIVDSYDAMTSNRPYRTGMAFDVAEKIIREGSGVQWDPALVEVFLKHCDEFRNICRESPDHCLSLELLDLNALSYGTDFREIEALPNFNEPALAN